MFNVFFKRVLNLIEKSVCILFHILLIKLKFPDIKCGVSKKIH